MKSINKIRPLFHAGWFLEELPNGVITADLEGFEKVYFHPEGGNTWRVTCTDPSIVDDIWEDTGCTGDRYWDEEGRWNLITEIKHHGKETLEHS